MRRAPYPAALLIALLWVPLTYADWPTGGKLISPPAGPDTSYAAAHALADGIGGATLTWLGSRRFDPDYHEVSFQHLTVFGDPSPGWPAAGYRGTWNTADDPHISREVLPLVSDGAGGAYQPFLASLDYLGRRYVLELLRLGADGSLAELGLATPFGVTHVTAAAVDADGSGGIVFIAQNAAYYLPPDPPPAVDLFVRRADATGTLQWSANTVLVPPGRQHPEWGLAAASDGSGGAYVAWVDGRDSTGGPGGTADLDLYLQHVLGDGSIAPGWPEGGVGVCTAAGRQEWPRLVHAGGGFVFVAWQDRRGPQPQVYVACLDGAGALAAGCPVDGRPLGDPNDSIRLLDLLADGTGGALALRADDTFLIGPNARTYCHRISPDGLPIASWPLGGRVLNAGGTNSPDGAMCGDGTGGAFALYPDGPAASPAGLYAIHLAADGTVAPGWSPGGALLSSTGIRPFDIDGSGGSAIALWTDTRHPEGHTVYAHRLQPEGPVAIAISLESAVARPDAALLRWHVADGAGLSATISRRTESTEWIALGARLPDGVGRIEFEDRPVIAGTRYGYRLEYDDLGSTQVAGEVWLEIPARIAFGLEPPRPNPVDGALTLIVDLDRDGPARIDLADVTGRRMITRSVPSNGPGRYVVEIAEAGRLPAGLYFARLTHDRQTRQRRVIVVR